MLQVLFFLVALVYASAGFGGGSSYLALMSLWGVPVAQMKATALLCNIVVVSGGVHYFWKGGHFSWSKTLPLALASAPMAFLGGSIQLPRAQFLLMLGIALVLAAVLMLIQPLFSAADTPTVEKQYTRWFASLLGAAIGFVSSLLGIGGGIFLSPLLYMLHWGSPKNIAAASSLFILVNSFTGLAGQWTVLQGSHDWAFSLPLIGAVFLGGVLGSRLSSFYFQEKWVRLIAVAVIFYAGVNLLVQR